MKIKVRFEPVEYELLDWEWRCLHPNTYMTDFETPYMTFEGIKEYIEEYEVCEECDSWYNRGDEEWESLV